MHAMNGQTRREAPKKSIRTDYFVKSGCAERTRQSNWNIYDSQLL